MAIKKLVEERDELTKVVKKKAAAKKVEAAPKKADHVLFVSANEEVVSFDITVMGEKITPRWDSEHEHLIWRVPSRLVDRFEMHEFVVKGRIIRED